MSRMLFCLVDGAISGGNKVFLELARDMAAKGEYVELFFWQSDSSPFLPPGLAAISSADTIEQAVSGDFDVIYFSHTFLLPPALPYVERATTVLFCQGYESFYRGDSYAASQQDSPALRDAMQLPDAIVSVSPSIQSVVKQRANRDSYLVPVGIDHFVFIPQPAADPNAQVKRILLVGNYLSPWKGMKDAFAALNLLAGAFDIQLVLITQEDRGRNLLSELKYPVEIHSAPPMSDIPSIYSSCHAYCCASWYEGIGLPKLEAFACGVPVVSTRDYGVDDFGIDGENLLLSNPNDPTDICNKLKRVLTDSSLALKLRENGFRAAAKHSWSKTVEAFIKVQPQILAQSRKKTVQSRSFGDMQMLSDRLEREGLFGPPGVYKEMAVLHKRFFQICASLVNEKVSRDTGVKGLTELSKEFELYAGNPDAEYYNDFKATFDACRLLVSLGKEPQFLNYVRAIAGSALGSG